MARDWLFETDEGTCNFRCAGVIMRNGKVLLQRDQGEYALIGGQVRIGETGENAVIREFQEELGVRIRCGQMLWSEECFWQWKGRMTHTLSFYYQIDFCEGSDFPDDGGFRSQLDNSRVEIGWVPLEKLKELTVYPAFLKERIFDLKKGHFITRA